MENTELLLTKNMLAQPAIKHSPVKAGELAVVVGTGASGAAAAKLLHRLGAKVRILEKNASKISAEFKELATELAFEVITGDHQPEDFTGAALVVPSPGVPLKILEPLLEKAGNPPMISELELGCLFVSQPILAITGTSGKTTTASIAAAMLEESGKKVFLGGNIGTPVCDYVLGAKDATVLVLEVSSFQLQGCYRFHPRVAVLLNLSENHLDQHKDMDEYRDAKYRIFMNQNKDDLGIIGQELFDEAMSRHLRCRTEFFSSHRRFKKTKLIGNHNHANLEAAYLAVKEFGVTLKQATAAAEKFAPLPHRLEKVGEWGGVEYINDSKCTTIEALRVALQSIDINPVILLAGGVFKGGDLESLERLVKCKLKALVLFGASREVFEKAWGNVVPTTWDATLEEAMQRIKGFATPGDVVLLAPATASFDLYENYKERGNDFKRLALSLNQVQESEE